MVILEWALIILSVPLIVMLIIHTRKRVHALQERIEEYHEEQDAAKSQPGPINPYEDLSRIIDSGPKKRKSHS